MFKKLPIPALALAVFSVCSCLAQSKLTFRPPDPLNPAAFQHFYDMYYERSIQEFTQVAQRHPDDPDAVNHLLTAVLFRELDRIGALDAGDYANDSFINGKHRPADPKTCDQIKQLVNKALGDGRKADGRRIPKMLPRCTPVVLPGLNSQPILP